MSYVGGQKNPLPTLHILKSLTIEVLDKGKLDYTLFKFGNNQKGGILCLSIVPNSKQKLWQRLFVAHLHNYSIH
ncbi:MAG: hypothetical protein DRQ49_01085 [Gammaproteobacteria bacterium]|nr:MAG: hypothetical protein DRQ49_01085 [Gammaproteobacteria bacterium]